MSRNGHDNWQILAVHVQFHRNYVIGYSMDCTLCFTDTSIADEKEKEPPAIDYDKLMENIKDLNVLAGEGVHRIQHTTDGARLKVWITYLGATTLLLLGYIGIIIISVLFDQNLC